MIEYTKMWIKKINEFYESISEYDNNSLILHVAVDLIDMLKERVSFNLDDDCNMNITVVKYGDMKEDTEVDEEGLLYWFQFTFHKELIDIILSLRQKFASIQDNNKKTVNEIKLTKDDKRKEELRSAIEKNNKELEALRMIMNKVETYRRNTFSFLRDKEGVERMLDNIRIYKEQSD